MKRYCFDIDGTICNNTWGEYEKAFPYPDRIEYVNQLYDSGNHITYLTARGMGTCDGDVLRAYAKLYNFTYEQLSEWGCKFHELRLGKPNADYYIDDKGISDKNFFEKL